MMPFIAWEFCEGQFILNSKHKSTQVIIMVTKGKVIAYHDMTWSNGDSGGRVEALIEIYCIPCHYFSWVLLAFYIPIIFKDFFKCLFLRERENTSREGAERKEDRGSEAGSVLTTDSVRRDSNSRTRDHDLN